MSLSISQLSYITAVDCNLKKRVDVVMIDFSKNRALVMNQDGKWELTGTIAMSMWEVELKDLADFEIY